jgi:serine phosphatase RsbU (regulator of sigma subunit)
MSLEQLSWLAPVAKSTGESLAAGVLCSPMLVAIPFLIAGCGLFGQSTVVVPQDLEVLYSRIPVLESLNVPSLVYALGFFGFGVPVLGRVFRYRWLRWAIVLPLGTVFFANAVRVVTGPLPAPLTAGFFTLALFGFLYKYFDLLAVLTLQLTSGIVLSMLMLAHTGGSIGPFVLVLVCSLGVAFWIATRGQAVVTGDTRAVNPELGFFRAEREKLQAEFSVARRAQEGMLPRHPPEIPGYTIAASCTPSLEVGGDLYDFLELPDGRIGLGVADVSGKGVPAALYMTLTKGLLASVSQDGADLATVVEQVNKHLHSVTRKKVFVTMALGFLDAEKRVLQCVRAGHNPMVWRQREKDTTTLVSPSGLGMGITASAVFRNQMKVEEMALAEGDAVVFYSDGITEAMNSQLEQFGEQRLMDVVAQTDHLDAAQTHDLILSAVREFLGGVHPQDDMTLVVLRVKDERMMVSG